MDSATFIELERTWGTFDDWQKDFIACSMASGNGWAVCGYNLFLKRVVNTFVRSNSYDVMLGLYPLIVLDCFEHSYFKDYLTDKKSYVVAMMRQINWNVVEERTSKVKAIAQALK
jgi:Fe-Mn family superoxide dismutase